MKLSVHVGGGKILKIDDEHNAQLYRGQNFFRNYTANTIAPIQLPAILKEAESRNGNRSLFLDALYQEPYIKPDAVLIALDVDNQRRALKKVKWIEVVAQSAS